MKHLLKFRVFVPAALFAAAAAPAEGLHERLPNAKPRNVVVILAYTP